MKKLFNGTFDIDSVVTKGKNEVDDNLRHSLTVKLSGVLNADDLAFLFGVPAEEAKVLFQSPKTSHAGFWDDKGAPYDDAGSFKPSAKYQGSSVKIYESITGNTGNGEEVAKFTDCELRSFAIYPNFGWTFIVSFAFFTTDIDDDGADIGRMAVHTKREVRVEVERPDDLFDAPGEPDE